MKNARSWIVAALAVAGVGCSDDKPFLPLDTLCATIAGEVCDARASCCQVGQDTGCEMRVEDACEAERKQLVADDSLSYDGTHADHVRDTLHAALLDCRPAFALGRFFEGGVAVGDACERDSQCESSSCDSKLRTCAKFEPQPLCDQADN